MVIPAVDGHLHEAHAGLAKAPGEQAGATVFVRGFARTDAVELAGGFGFFREVHQLRSGGLHAEGGLKAMDHAFEAGIGGIALKQAAVHALDEIETAALRGAIGGGVGEEIDGGIAFLGREDDGRALMRGGQEGGAVEAGIDAGMDGEKAGQVLIFGAEAIADP